MQILWRSTGNDTPIKSLVTKDAIIDANSIIKATWGLGDKVIDVTEIIKNVYKQDFGVENHIFKQDQVPGAFKRLKVDFNDVMGGRKTIEFREHDSINIQNMVSYSDLHKNVFELENDFYDFLDSFLFILQIGEGMAKKRYDKFPEKCDYNLKIHKVYREAFNADKIRHLANELGPHHHGMLNSLLIEARLLRKHSPTKHDFENYFNDFHHGLIHGIFTAFINFLLHRNDGMSLDDIQYNENYINGLLSCLLHDFAKPYDNHDLYLNNFFPNLLAETYSHSNPSNSNEKEKLIISDRCELFRCDDVNDWVDQQKALKHLPSNMFDKIKLFYSHIRPSFLRMLNMVNEPIISHSIEGNEFPPVFPQIYPWSCDMKWANLYCAYVTYFEDNAYGWGCSPIVGVAPLKRVKANTINDILPRDHINVMDSPPNDISDWVFLNKRKNKEFHLSEHELYFIKNNIYPINVELTLKLLQVRRQFTCVLSAHTMDRM